MISETKVLKWKDVSQEAAIILAIIINIGIHQNHK